MNKQELIEKYEAEKNEILDYQNSDIWKEEGVLQKKASVTALRWVFDFVEDLKNLDEPQKVKVPQFVAEWYEEKKEDLEFYIYQFCVDYAGSYQKRKGSEFYLWFDKSENKPIETLIRMQEGYEVEEEPKYKVIMPNPQSKNGNVLVLRRTQQGTITVNKVKETTARLGEGMELTEKEIKSVDERYWPFTVPVEKV